jgi:KUP system potassium uptake protein
LLITFLLSIDLAFFSANMIKIEEGGWFPLVFGFGVFLLMTTWKQGRQLLRDRLQRDALDLLPFANSMDAASVTRVAGTAVFLTANPDGVPHALLHNMKHNKVLHQQVVVLCVRILDIPYVEDEARIEHQALANNFHRLIVRFGFKDEPDLPQALALGAQQGLPLNPMETSFFIGRETLIPKVGSDMPVWREKLFIAMYRNAGSVVSFFKIPPNSVVELGTQVIL